MCPCSGPLPGRKLAWKWQQQSLSIQGLQSSVCSQLNHTAVGFDVSAVLFCAVPHRGFLPCRRSFKYKPLGDDEESAPITAAAAAADMDASSSSPSCHAAAGGGLGGLTADLEAAEAAAAAEAASKAVRASRTAHKESFTAAAQVGRGVVHLHRHKSF